MAEASPRGVAFVAGWEGFRSCPYRDAVGVWTIGYGETLGVGPNTPCISEPKAREKLKARLTRDFLNPAVQKVRHDLKQREKDAIGSFAYNVGLGAWNTSSLLEKLNKRRCRFYRFRKQAYREELPRWTNGGLAGLVKRRAAEVKMACEGDYSGRP